MSLDVSFTLSLLGTPRITLSDEQPVVIENPLMLQLLALLMLNPQKTFLRSELCALFYPEHDQKQAEQNLRQTIHRLRKAIGDPDDETALLLREPMTLTLNPQRLIYVDVTRFNEYIQRVKTHHHRRIGVCNRCIKDLEAAACLYRDEFMSGVPFQGALEEWAFAQRSMITRKIVFVLSTLTSYYIEQGCWFKAQEYLDRWLTIDALDEDAAMLQMRLFATQGKRLFALQFYNTFVQLLESRLGVPPSAATSRLAQVIQEDRLAGEIGLQMPIPNESSSSEVVYHMVQLPPEIGMTKIPFIGRSDEIAGIIDRLVDKTTRLITLTGMGGIGKTSLALHVASLDAAHWQDGVVVVSLKNTRNLALKLSEALQIPADTVQSTTSELYRYLRDKEMLLILDEIDQLPDVKYALKTLLFYAPHIKIIGTSRQRLGIGMELNIHLGGLHYPEGIWPGMPSQEYASVQLFIASAHTFHPQVTFSNADLVLIAQLCQFVQGSPMAIILAAAWTHALPCEQIFEYIRQDPNFLRDRYAALTSGHESLREVFEYSWVLLSPLEQKSLARLATLEGAFTLMDAQVNYAISADLVMALADKSLLEMPQPAHFQVYSLFKPFIFEMEDNQRWFKRGSNDQARSQ